MIVQDRRSFEAVLEKLAGQPEIVLDCETTGLKVKTTDRLCGIGLRISSGESWYLPFRHKRWADDMDLFQEIFGDDGYNLPLEWLPELWASLAAVGKLIGHNVMFDLNALARDGYRVPGGQLIEETLCGGRLAIPGKQPDLSLEGCVKAVLDEDLSSWKAEFKAYLEERKITKHYDRAEVEVAGAYCEADCDFTWRIRDAFVEFAAATGQTECYEVEQEVVNILWEMQQDGIRIDKEFIANAIPKTEAARAAVYASLLEWNGGRDFNPWSNPELSRVFSANGVRAYALTKTKTKEFKHGVPSWADEVLQRVDHPMAAQVLNWRALDKMLSTYFYPYRDIPGDTVHASYKSWGPVTGRFSCEDPNLQQLSRRVEWSIPEAPNFDIQVREMFVPPEGYAMVAWDYKQMEMVVFADYCNDPKLTARINEGGVDYHDMVTEMVWKIQPGHPSFKATRQRAKAISLGLIFGMGVERLAATIRETEGIAKEYRDEYFSVFKTAKKFISRVYDTVRERGYLFNRFGRRYYLDEDHAYKGVNYLVQGTSADIVKRALVLARRGLREARSESRLAAQVHDEFLAYVKLGPGFKRDVRIVRDAMETQWLKTNLRVDVSVADPDWGHKVELCRECLEKKGECECERTI